MELQQFARAWIDSWNSHDIDDIMSHYSDDVEITSPMIRIAGGTNADSLKGKAAVKGYWERALIKIPDLHFELFDAEKGVNSVALYYKSVMNKKSIEVMFFDDEGKVNRIFAHYSE